MTLSVSDGYAQTSSEGDAQAAARELGTCLTDYTTGRDRKDLARWIFAAMSVHPEIDAIAGVTEADREETSRTVGALVTRLLAESCAEEVRSATENSGTSGIEAGFGILGEVAMQELMNDEQVAAAMGDVALYIDEDRLQEVFQEQ